MNPSDENSQIGAAPGAMAARRLDAGARRNLLIMACVIVVAVGIVVTMAWLGLRSSDQPVTPAASKIALGNSSTVPRDPNEPVSQRMQEQVAQRNAIEADQAARAGRSYIPPDSGGRIEPVPAERPAGPTLTAANSTGGNAAAQVGVRSVVDEDRRKGLERFLERFSEVGGAGDDGDVRRRFSAAGTGSSEGGQRVAGAAATKASAPQAVASQAGSGRKLVEGFTVMATRLVIPLNIPANGSATVLAEVVSGPQAGAFITGTGKVVNEGIEIRLTQARFGSEMYTVQAIGLDGRTSDQILDGSVDRKLFQRYVIPIAAAAAQGYFAAKAAVGSTVVGLNVGSTSAVAGVQTPAPTSTQAVAAGLGAGMQVLAADAKTASSVPIVVSIPSQTPMGVLFLNEVVEKGAQP